MFEVKHIGKGKLESVGRSEFTNEDNSKTISIHLNFINILDNGNLELIKVKVKDCNDISKLEKLKGKEIELLLEMYVMNNKVYYSTKLENIK